MIGYFLRLRQVLRGLALAELGRAEESRPLLEEGRAWLERLNDSVLADRCAAALGERAAA
jgi:hypothetical protein